jgi:hypothetical protein
MALLLRCAGVEVTGADVSGGGGLGAVGVLVLRGCYGGIGARCALMSGAWNWGGVLEICCFGA